MTSMPYASAWPIADLPRRPAGRPRVTWSTPAQLASARLSRRERLRLLDDWAQALADRDLEAGARGLPLPSDQALVREVAAAIAHVNAEPETGLLDRLRRR